jgi:tetratricopeptide (TPR) repeat protein
MSTDIVPNMTDRHLWQVILSDTVIHPVSHLTCLYFEYGKSEKAVEVHQAIIEDLLSLDDNSRWQGVTIYNLGCTYALSGKKEKAIELLGQALKVHPDLKDWSQHDPDLESIRNEPKYLELYS